MTQVFDQENIIYTSPFPFTIIPQTNTKNEEAVGGLRFDQGKTRLDLLPPELLEGVGQVLSMGALKYAPRNWEKGMKWGRVYASLMRHLLAWQKGEKVDTESGLSHLWHVATNAAFLITYEARGIGEDDRFVEKK